MKRVLYWGTLVAAAGIVGVFFVAYLNAAVALDDAYEQVRYQRQTIETLRGVLEGVSRHLDRATITRVVEQRANSSYEVKREAASVSLKDIVFVFEGEKVSAVRLLQSSGSQPEPR
jgi:hypothetical protein